MDEKQTNWNQWRQIETHRIEENQHLSLNTFSLNAMSGQKKRQHIAPELPMHLGQNLEMWQVLEELNIWVDLAKGELTDQWQYVQGITDLQSIKRKEKEKLLFHFYFSISHKMSLMANTKSELCRKENYRKCISSVANVTEYKTTIVMVVWFKNRDKKEQR